MARASTGFLETDGVTHYLYARTAFDNPALFVDAWARPVRVMLHAVPAYLFGLAGVRAASLVCAIAIAWITYATAKRLDWERPALAGVFVLAQPLLFLHSFSELTEIPFALLAAASFHSLIARRWWLFALLCGLMPASRPEGLAFVLLAFVMLSLHRRFIWMPLVLLPLIAWNHAGWMLWGSNAGPWSRWLIDRIPYSGTSLYGAGPIWRFLAVLPAVVSPLLLPAVFIGTAGILATGPSRARDHVTRLSKTWLVPDVWLIAVIPWGILAVHSWLHFTGRMSSSGEPRYLLAVAPFWGLLACKGWQMAAERFAWRRPTRLASIAIALPIIANFAYPVLPLKPQPDAVLCKQIADWYRTSPIRDTHPHVFATHPLIYFYLDRMVGSTTREMIEHPPTGAMFVYDNMNASYNSDASRVITPEMFDAGGWTRANEDFSLPKQTWIVFLSPQPEGAPTVPHSPSVP